MMRGVLAITLIVAYIDANVEAGTVLLHDPSSKILQQQATPSSVTQAASAGALCAATALVPPYKLSADTAKQVEGIVQHNVFNKPKAVVLLNIAGLAPESSSVQQLLESFGSGHTVRLDVADSSKPATAGSMLQATSDIASANPDLAVKVLDHSALKGCHAATCMAGHLSTAAHRCGGKLHQQQQRSSKAGLAGSLALPGVDAPLDLAHPAARLFGIELAGLQGASQQELDVLRMQQQQEEDQDMVVYESTFVGLQGLAALHPAGSQALAAAEAALVGLLGGFAGQLKEVFGDDVLYQVSLLGDVPVSSGQASDLMGWKEVSRRVLLQRSSADLAGSNAPSEAAFSKSFANKATGYAVALILIWFTFAGTYCMVAMRFKQDTLLYGRAKTD